MGATLGGSGWVMDADSIYSSSGMTSDGFVPGSLGTTFRAAKIRSITGGTSPQVQVRSGRLPTGSVVRTAAATQGTEIDRRSAGDAMPDGIYLTVTGSPAKFDIEILFK